MYEYAILTEPFYLNIMLMGDTKDVLHKIKGVRDKDIYPIWIPVIDNRYVGSCRRNDAVTMRKAYWEHLNEHEVWAQWKLKTVKIIEFH
ncbi:MAG: hypothetical protein PHW73_01785 [Atribacterota bacterium]|nr:hypothetical protein [Atribacterota bacterium]